MTPKLLIVHIPKLENLYPPIGYHMTVTFPAASLSLLADIAVKAGYTTEVLHLGAEYVADL